MKKFLVVLSVAALVACFFALSVSAAATDEFGTPEVIDGIDLTDMNADTVARVVIVDANGDYHTYPAMYVVSSSTKFSYNFNPINDALKTNYNKHSIVRIEVPDNIEIAANCGDLSSCQELLEIKFFPTSELHTLEYGCFFNNKKLLKLNIPKKVQTMETLLINSSSKLEELVFDDGFCAIPPRDSFIGAKNLKKIVFSNQMTTVHRDSFFDSFTNVKEIYLGESLVDIGEAAKVDGSGSDGGNFSYTDGPIKIYASSNLFASINTIERGRLNGWTGNRLLKGVLFYTGTREQAQALIDKAANDTPIFNNATLVEWDSSLSDDEYMPANNSWNIVYSYNVCNAFHGGEHILTGEDSAKVVDFLTEIRVGDICTREGCGIGTTSKVIAPIFEDLGISVSEKADANGKYSITRGYKINRGAYNEYLEYGVLKFGLVAAAVDVAGSNPMVIADGKIAPACEKVLTAGQERFAHDYVDFKLTGLSDTLNGKQIVLSMYVYDGSKIDYLSNVITVDVGE